VSANDFSAPGVEDRGINTVAQDEYYSESRLTAVNNL